MSVPVTAPAGLTEQEAVGIVARMCARAGTPAGDARIVQPPIVNAVILLPEAGLVGRVADRVHRERMRRELEVAAWLIDHGVPAGPPAPQPPCPQVSEDDGRVVTWWTYLGPMTKSSMPEAVTVLRRFHQVPAPPGMVRLDPFAGMSREIESATGMQETDREAMHAARREMSEAWHASHWVTDPPVLVHGDAHWTNIERTPAGLRVIDFEHSGLGPWEWDLATYAAFLRLGWVDQPQFNGALQVYGRDPREAPDFELLVRIRLLRLATLVAAATNWAPQLAEQARRRFAGLSDPGMLAGWWWGDVSC